MTEPMHLTSNAYSELARHVLALARRDDAMAVAGRMIEMAQLIGEEARTRADLSIGELLSMAGLAVAELRTALTEAKLEAFLADAAAEFDVLLPSDFEDPAPPTGDENADG